MQIANGEQQISLGRKCFVFYFYPQIKRAEKLSRNINNFVFCHETLDTEEWGLPSLTTTTKERNGQVSGLG